MPNQFLVEIHNHLSRQIERSLEKHEQARSMRDANRLSFYAGKLDELMKLRKYLSKAFDLHTQRYY